MKTLVEAQVAREEVQAVRVVGELGPIVGFLYILNECSQLGVLSIKTEICK